MSDELRSEDEHPQGGPNAPVSGQGGETPWSIPPQRSPRPGAQKVGLVVAGVFASVLAIGGIAAAVSPTAQRVGPTAVAPAPSTTAMPPQPQINLPPPPPPTTSPPTTTPPTTSPPTIAVKPPPTSTSPPAAIAAPAPAPAPDSSGLSNDNTYVNSDGNVIHSPAGSTNGQVPAGATAQCTDGTYSFSQHHSGTCSSHGGVSKWLP
jgi:hypothetical protein